MTLARSILLFIGTMVVLLATVSAVAATQSHDDLKNQFLAQQAAAQAAAEKGRHAPKPQNAAVPARARSCPIRVEPGVYPILGGPPPGYHKLVNRAVISRGDAAFVVFAGSADENPWQGILVVMRLDSDPCRTTTSYTRRYDVPGLAGPATVESISGDAVIYRTAAGTGTFDPATGQFGA